MNDLREKIASISDAKIKIQRWTLLHSVGVIVVLGCQLIFNIFSPWLLIGMIAVGGVVYLVGVFRKLDYIKRTGKEIVENLERHKPSEPYLIWLRKYTGLEKVEENHDS